MKRTIPKLFAVMSIAGLSSACSSDHMNDDAVSAFDGQIQAASAEVTRHHEAALATSTLPGLMAEFDRHDQRMRGIVDRMNGMMPSMMSHCSGSGMGRMREGMDIMDSEMRSHGQEMTQATALEEARSRCTAHTDAMKSMLDDMHAGLGEMGCMGNR